MVEGVKMGDKKREIWTGKNRHYLGEDNILYITAVGELDEKAAIEWKKADFKLLEMVNYEEEIKIIIDLNKAGKPSVGAIKLFLEMNKERKNVKTAFFGFHPVSKVLASFFISSSKNKNIRFFKTKEEAIAWLNEP